MNAASPRVRLLVAGGGTAGHVLPGLAIVGEMIDRGLDPAEVLWVGAQRGQEAELVPPVGIDIELLPGRGLQRRMSLQNLRSMAELVVAMWRGFGIVRRASPACVLTLGGYASLAAGLASVILRVPIVVAEQNASAGAANKLIGRFARACAVPFDVTDLPHKVVTGNPVRAEILAVSRNPASRLAARTALGLPPDRLVISAFAGSLGSRRINGAVVAMAERLAERDDLAVHHVVGHRDWSEHVDPPSVQGGLHYQAVPYESRMDLVLAASDLAISRSGGSTVSELAVVGVPSILVPLPIAPRDHQTANARGLVDVGAAILLDDADCVGATLEGIVVPLLDDPQSLEAMASAAVGVGHRDAAARVADLIEGNSR